MIEHKISFRPVETDEKADADDIWTEKPQDNNTPADETEAPAIKSPAIESAAITSPKHATPSSAGTQPETPAPQIDPPAEPPADGTEEVIETQAAETAPDPSAACGTPPHQKR